MDPTKFVVEINLDGGSPTIAAHPAKRRLEKITEQGSWGQECRRLLALPDLDSNVRDCFHERWVVSGHRIREQIGDDRLLCSLLHHMLPSYSGKGLRLYRGENAQRWQAGKLGFCWTPDSDVAVMFARGLNALDGGGVLLACDCKADWIISGIHRHSDYLGEGQYTVDPFAISDVEVLAQYAP